jgi:hypothetical protein
MLGRATTQNAEAAQKAEERVHKLEVALADLQLDHLASRNTPVATVDDIEALQRRIGEIEQRPIQATATPDDLAALQSRVNAIELRPDAPAGVSPEAIVVLDQRMGVMERCQAESLEALRADIVRFVSDNDRRLAALEHTEVDYNLAAEFDGLRRRVEERILGIEQRSVRTLEQVADTVQMLEERFMGGDDSERQTA